MILKIISQAEERVKKRVAATGEGLVTIRTGRASTSFLNRLTVDYYQAKVALKQMASISVPEPQLVVIQPWDKNALEAIEKAILKSDLGLTPSNDGQVIRLFFPPLSEERRQELVRLARRIAEEGRVGTRHIRRETNESLETLEKKGEISEDELYRARGQVQKVTDKYISQIDEMLKDKEKSIMEV